MASENFASRLSHLYGVWKQKAKAFGGCSTLAITTGKIDADSDIGYLKSYALFAWMFGEELQSTMLLAQPDKLTVLCVSPKDVAKVSKIVERSDQNQNHNSGELPSISVVAYKKSFLEVELKPADGPLGVLPKEKHEGELINDFKAVVQEKGLGQENIAEGLAYAMSVKDDAALKLIRRAATLSCAVMKGSLVRELVDILERDRKVTHARLSEKVEQCILDPAKINVKDVDPMLCDACYPPIIQSNGTYSLKFSAQSDEKHLHAGCIVASLGARYASYCSNVSRTFLVNASKEQEKIYEALLIAQQAAIDALKPGAKLSKAYEAASRVLEERQKGLASNLNRNVGFGIGIEFTETTFVLNATNERVVEEGMVFNVAVGLQGLKDATNGVYALFVADTVAVIGGSDSGVEVYTASSKKTFKAISYTLDDDAADEEEENDDLNPEGEILQGRRSRHAKSANDIAATAEEIDERRKHQEELARRKLEEGKARFRREGGPPSVKTKKEDKQMDEYSAYDSPAKYPVNLRPRLIHVDMDAEAVMLPINGVPVPFHISMVKNVGKIDEGEVSFLRLNFHTPASSQMSGRVKSENALKFPDVAKDFVKEATFRSGDSAALNDVVRKIRELRRRFLNAQQEEKEPETVMQEEQLIVDRTSGRNAYLPDVAVRPNMLTGKANRGILEAHTNGFRYRMAKGQVLDIIYSNIKHAFFQEADREIIVLIHFHLRNPILIKNKKTNDVQFYVEVMESAVKLNETRRKAYDQDELMEEQREREMRNRMNKIFLRFTKDIEEKYNLEFDAPYRDLGFNGAPKNAHVFLMPTISCIVSLIEWPPFVLALGDVEIAYFERVSFALREFDLVFVFKGFEAETQRGESWSRISSIPVQSLDALKKFLDEQEIKYYEGPKNLMWDNVLNHIRADIEDFYDNNGWAFLDMDASDSGDNEDEDDEDESEEDGGEAFKLDKSDDESEDDEEDSDDDYDDSDDSGGAAEELGGDSEEGEEDLSSEEEGLDWDQLEAKAAKEDAAEVNKYDDRNDHRGNGRAQSRRNDADRKRRRR